MRKTTFYGKVITGGGTGKKYVELPWVKEQIREKLGFTPFPGTLNLVLTPQCIKKRKDLHRTNSKMICHAEGYCAGLLFKASINDLECAVVLPQVDNYPSNVLEIIAPTNLRTALNLKDRDTLAVTVYA